ncbi:MAG: coproporphyrinogen III oxidase [Ignavibacteriaceae bacterium]|nr:MAG: radical SAM family heme chaperone HemW [Chlorobiota bacterium]GJQ31617.1 MAG: coproporphyrinogen III oxidase [Ignavibacteriaceae bacterium]
MKKEAGIYVHIPFCDHKCIYCDFYSIIKDDSKALYLANLKREIDHFARQFSDSHIFRTIYFGGGTPSLVEPEYLGEIIAHLKNSFELVHGAEITMETNPGTVSREKLAAFHRQGINRISIGIQSFDPDDLNFLTRIHDADAAIRTVHDAAEAGFGDISIDLIFNLPGQDLVRWKKNLEIATSLPITHISAYSLILEKGTILNKMVLKGEVEIQDEEIDSQLYELTMDFLAERGFVHYEVSNYCKPGFECKHNTIYWDCENYLSFGTSAHSYMEGRRWWNYSALSIYNSAVEKREEAVAGSEELTPHDLYEEYVMLALRSRGLRRSRTSGLSAFESVEEGKGLPSLWFDERATIIEPLIAAKKIVWNGDLLKLTRDGFSVCDEIVERLL